MACDPSVGKATCAELRFDVADATATAQAGQTCSFNTYIRCSPTCITGYWTLAYGTLSMQLETNDTLAIAGSGTWTYRVDQSTPVTCTEMLTASASRASR